VQAVLSGIFYHSERSFQEQRKHYASTLDELGPAQLGYESLAAPPRISATAGGFQASVDIRLPDGQSQQWHLREDSRVWPDPAHMSLRLNGKPD
jgi:hypothetical protein